MQIPRMSNQTAIGFIAQALLATGLHPIDEKQIERAVAVAIQAHKDYQSKLFSSFNRLNARFGGDAAYLDIKNELIMQLRDGELEQSIEVQRSHHKALPPGRSG